MSQEGPKTDKGKRLLKFVGSTLRIALALVIAVMAVGVLGLVYSSWQDHSRRAGEAPLAQIKKWPPKSLAPLGNAKVSIQSVWRNNRIEIKFALAGFSDIIRDTVDQRGQTASFIIELQDNDGFRLFSQNIRLSEMTQIVGDDGTPAGLSWQGGDPLTSDDYRRATQWDITWAGFLKPRSEEHKSPERATESSEKWHDITAWRKLSRGQSHASVRSLLGQPGKIDNNEYLGEVWYYNYPFGGEVHFSGGRVSSWSEPSR